MKKLFPYLFAIAFILVFSFFFGWEYKDFYEKNKAVENSQIELQQHLEGFSLDKIKEIENISIAHTPDIKLLEQIVQKIDSAKEKVYLEVYIFTEKRIKEALKRAKNRLVEVKVLLEHNPYKAPGINNKTYAFLKEAGIEIVWSNTKHYALNHAKTIVIDEENILSTWNFSYSNFTKNRDFFIFLRDPVITPILTQVFLNDFYHKKNILYHDNLVLSPNYSREKFETLFNSAKKSIKVYFPYIQDAALKNILLERAKLWIMIELITDRKFEKTNSDAINELTKAWIQVKTLDKYSMHSKAIFIDETYLFLGSVNFSEYSLDKNKEVGVIMKNRNMIEKFKEIFERDWNMWWN